MQGTAARQSRGAYLKVDSKKARALATEMQITQMTSAPYTISHLGSLCSATGLQASEPLSVPGEGNLRHDGTPFLTDAF